MTWARLRLLKAIVKGGWKARLHGHEWRTADWLVDQGYAKWESPHGVRRLVPTEKGKAEIEGRERT